MSALLDPEYDVQQIYVLSHFHYVCSEDLEGREGKKYWCSSKLRPLKGWLL